MKATFRAATIDDLEILLHLMQSLWEGDHVAFDSERAEKATLQLINDPSAGAILLIEADGVAAGYLVLTRGYSLEFGRHLFIDELFVSERYRKCGLGSSAVRYACAECMRIGGNAVLLEAALSNEGATRLYRRFGFREHPRRLMSVRLGPESQLVPKN